jgi:membrane protease YdiL (CAAX protease family)
MSDLTRPEIARPLMFIGLLLLAAGLRVWAWIARRYIRGQPIIAYEPRRPVPWGGLDVLLVVAFLSGIRVWIATVDAVLFPVPREPPPEVVEAAPDASHPLVVLLRYDRSLASLAWCLAAGVLVAPIAEEVLFRLLLQGWLEALERRWRRRLPALRRVVRGLLPILAASLAFAALHFREAGPAVNPRWLLHAVVRGMATYVLTVGFAVALVQIRVGATAADLGFSRARFWSDVRLGLLAFLAVAAPVYLLQFVLSAALPGWLAPDPITLLLFAFVLGVLYHRTHRIVPSIALHMALNATSLAALAWLTMGRGGW